MNTMQEYQLGSNVIDFNQMKANYQTGYNPIYKTETILETTLETKSNSRKIKKRIKIVEPCQPIKDLADIEKAKNYLFNKAEKRTSNTLRDYCLFVLCINIAKRIGDVLNLTVDDIFTEKFEFRKDIRIITDKKEKAENFRLSASAKEVLGLYLGMHPEILDNRENGLFPTKESNGKSMSRVTAWRMFKKIEALINDGKEENDQVKISTHSGRKTFAYQSFMKNIDNPYMIEMISEALGHDSVKTTRAYLGFNAEALGKFYEDNGL